MVLDCEGRVHTFGCPEYGQLGRSKLLQRISILLISRQTAAKKIEYFKSIFRTIIGLLGLVHIAEFFVGELTR